MNHIFNISIADMTFQVTSLHRSTEAYCAQYLIEAEGEHKILINQQDIDYERVKFCEEYEETDPSACNASDAYLETIALLRKLADYITLHNRFLMHGSTVEVNGKGYIFTALSGTGKSTHTRLLRKLLGDRISMINDDKPFIYFKEDGVYVCGTPWMGKHRLGNPVIRPLGGIFFLRRSEENELKAMEPEAALMLLMSQIHRPEQNENMLNTLEMMDKLLFSVPLYDLGCNMDISAAELSSSVM